MEIFMTGTATDARGFSAALTRVSAVAYPSAVTASLCPSTADLGWDKAHNGQGGHPPRGSEALR